MDNLCTTGASNKLEPEVHIVNQYMQLVKKCLTMTNIHLKGGKEIDILALNPKTNQKYHIEVRIATSPGFKLRLKDTQTKTGRKHKRGLDTLNQTKFTHKTVVDAIKQIFGTTNYHKILVVWEVENNTVIEKAKQLYNIQIWKMPQIIKQLKKHINTKAYRNDILRTIQLITKS